MIKHEKETVRVSGFYDGDGVYKVRFMPSFEGTYTYQIIGSYSDTASVEDSSFAPSPGNHGPVRVANRFHLAYADGTPHYSVGTTCYAFALQREEIVEQTFRELEKGCFNKLRFCLMPKHYDFCLHDPVLFPYEGTPMDAGVLTRQNFSDYSGAAPRDLPQRRRDHLVGAWRAAEGRERIALPLHAGIFERCSWLRPAAGPPAGRRALPVG